MAIFKQGLPEWQKAGSKPPGTMITNGWAANQKPPADYFNWFFNTTYMALKELQEVADREFIKRDGTVTLTNALKTKLTGDSGNVFIINEGSKTQGFVTAITPGGYIVVAPTGSDGNPDWTKQMSLNRLGGLDVQGLTIKGEPIALAKDYLPLLGGEMSGAIASFATTPIQARLPNNLYSWNRGKQSAGTVIKVESRLAGATTYTQSLEITVGSGVGAVSADGNFTIDAMGPDDSIVKGIVPFGHTLRYSVGGVYITTGVSVAQYWYRVTRSEDGSKDYIQFGAPLDFSGIGGTIGSGINFVQAYLRFNGRDIAVKDEVLLLTGGELTGTVHTRASIAYTGKVGDIKHYINPQPVGTVIRFELFIDGAWSKSLDITVGDTTITGTSDFFLNPMTNTTSYITGIGPLEATKTKATVISTGANTISGAALPTFWWLRILRNFYDTCIQAGKNLIFSGYGNAQLEKVEFKTATLTHNGKNIINQDAAVFTSAANFDFKGSNGNALYVNKGDVNLGWLLIGVDPAGNYLIAPTSSTGGVDLTKKIMIERNGCINALNFKINGKQVASTDDVATSKSEAILAAIDSSKSYTDTSIANHSNDEVRHITASERADWNAKETPATAQIKADKAETNSKAFTTSELNKLKAASTWNRASFKSGSGFSHFAGAEVNTTISADGKLLCGRGTGAISNPSTAQIEAFTLPASYEIDFSASASVPLQNSAGTARILIDAATKKVLVNISDTNATGVMFSFAVPIKL